MEVGVFTIENADEKSWGNYFVRRIINITSNKVIYYYHHEIRENYLLPYAFTCCYYKLSNMTAATKIALPIRIIDLKFIKMGPTPL